MIRTFRTHRIPATIVSTVAIAGCSITHKATQSQRTNVEQLLITEAVQRSLPEDIDKLLPIPGGTAVTLQTSVISVPTEVSTEKFLVQQVIEGWLGQNGYAIQKDEKNATYRVSVIVGALGRNWVAIFLGCLR